MPVPDISLFSLEIVIDKLYIPHITCRFPAVAFRLLDFPTILIKHVEDGLGERIKEKISRDPYYSTPQQFSELQDDHGNYMVKRGKSCLFKTSIDSLKTHLANTPLYVMVLDMYPDTPKLIGNSSVPLDNLMKDICMDVAKNGVTVPSVHGDKGLFKVYSLMGKEIGYIVLGFRILCLGPSMAGHISSKPILQSNLKKETKVDKERGTNLTVIDVKPIEQEINSPNIEKKFGGGVQLRSSQDMGSMTDTIKHDVLLQTIQTEDKAVHVVISEPPPAKPKHSSTSTQTQKRQKTRDKHILCQGLDMKIDSYEEEDELDVPNIICPPPLFYNKYSEPKLTVARPIDYTDDESSDDISEIGSLNGRKVLDSENISNRTHHKDNVHVPTLQTPANVPTKNQSRHSNKPIAMSIDNNIRNNLQTEISQNPSQTVFPVLTALLNELIGIQGTHGLENVIQQVNNVVKPAQKHAVANKCVKEDESVPHSVLRPTVSSERKSSLRKTDGVKSAKNKSWIRKVPSAVPSKVHLTYRLTKTQKLRLAKGNPKWLEEKVKKEESMKMQKDRPEGEDDLNVTNFSDTLTEVRRLAEKELADQTLDSIQDIQESKTSSNQSSYYQEKKRTMKPKAKRSPKIRHKKAPPSPKLRTRQSISPCDSRKQQAYKSTTKEMIPNPLDVQVMDQNTEDKSSSGVEPELRRFVSPDRLSSDVTDEDNDRAGSVMSQKSVEVHIPKAVPEYESDEDIELPDNDKEGSHISGILRRSQTSFDMSETVDDNTPLESTRTSQNIYQSTIDNDTKQFLSTEEPELKKLMSDDNSDVSEPSQRYVPTFASGINNQSLRSSLKFPVVNPVASQNSPIPTTRKSTVKSEGKLTPRNSGNVSSPGSSRVVTPRKRYVPRVRESIHTESVSSYLPSDGDAVLSMASSTNYSDDFQVSGTASVNSSSEFASSPEIPRRIPSTKLGYTIS